MKTLKNIEGTPLNNVGIVDSDENSHNAYFHPETGVVSVILRDGAWKLISEPLNIIDILNDEAPNTDLTEEFSLLLGKEVGSLSLCANGCERPWNIEPNAVRCGPSACVAEPEPTQSR